MEKNLKKRSIFGDVDITGGPLLSSMIIYTIPLIIANVLQFFYNAVDVMVVGNFASGSAVAAVGATTSIINFFMNVIFGIAVGSNILISRSIGEKNDEGTKKIIGTSFILGISVGVLGLIVGEILAVPLLRITDCPENIIDGAALYIRIYLLGMPAMGFYNYMSVVLRANGDSKRPLLYLAVSGITNVVLNLVFVIVFSMDVAGVAIATIVAQYLSAIMLFVRLTRLDGACRLVVRDVRFNGRIMLKVIRYGIPTMVSNIAFSLANIQIASIVNSYGDAAIAGNTASNNMQGIFITALTSSFSVNCSTFVGENIGAGDRKRTFRIVLLNYTISVLAIALSSATALIFEDFFLSLFVPQNAEAIAYGAICNKYIIGFSFLLGIMVINNQIVQAFGYTTYQMVASLAFLCGFRMIWLALVYPMHPTFECVMITYPISWVLINLALIPLVIWCVVKYIRGRDFKL